MAKMKIAPGDRARVKLECVRLLSTLRLNEAKMHLILGFVDTYLRLNDDEQKIYQTELEKLAPVEKEQIVEATMSWAERAEQKGLQQGLQQGMLTLVTKQIEHRFGPIDSQTRERLSGLSSDQLESLGDALMDFFKPEDLAKWLQSL
jgi:flagellar biosynthesis/type III secretory pathway protein FliH